MLEARMKCTNDDSTMRLIGEKILEPDIKFSQQFANLWVDISRHITDVYTINWEPENRKGMRTIFDKYYTIKMSLNKFESNTAFEFQLKRERYLVKLYH